MIYDAVREDEIFEAYLLYASLHGLCTEESQVRQRIASYLGNQPDAIIDDAILAFAEDRIVAPPDVVIEQWGKSRVYELELTPQGLWRHQVSDDWFENGCRFFGDQRDAGLAHFWTSFEIDSLTSIAARYLSHGIRLQFRCQAGRVLVIHRQLGQLGQLPAPLAEEVLARATQQMRYLPLIDCILPQDKTVCCKVLVAVAKPDIEVKDIVGYAVQAFHARRNKC